MQKVKHFFIFVSFSVDKKEFPSLKISVRAGTNYFMISDLKMDKAGLHLRRSLFFIAHSAFSTPA
jgi:hypothetical protein